MPVHQSPLPRASLVHQRGHWKGIAVDRVILDFEDRHRRRLAMAGVGGVQFLLDLPEAQHLHGGDALELDDGRLIEIVGMPESLVEAKAHDGSGMARLAWHIGNRHLPVEITATALRIRADKIIEEMLEGLGAKLSPLSAPFEPEGPAPVSDGQATHSHDDHHP